MTTPTSDHLVVDIEAIREAVSGGEPDLFDGRAVADALESQLARAADALEARGAVPTLAVVRVGEDPASKVYVEHKTRACNRIGLESRHVHRPSDVSEADLLALLDALSDDDDVDGLLLQLPLPDHVDAHRCIERIAPLKDVDGFHPRNMGCLMAGRGEFEACTPTGVMTMLRAYDVPVVGRDAVVVGRSRTVGRPMAQMLIRADATVTVCHRHTDALDENIARADIVVVATGVPELVDGQWIKEGAHVIDVGISREGSGGLVGDVDFEGARPRAARITPVPGGVGPMTVATLMENTLRAALRRRGLQWDGHELRDIAPEDGHLCSGYRD